MRTIRCMLLAPVICSLTCSTALVDVEVRGDGLTQAGEECGDGGICIGGAGS